MNEPLLPDRPPAASTPGKPAWIPAAMLILAALSGLSLWQAVSTASRVRDIEQELVRRQQDSQNLATEARVLARQTQDLTRETAARTALLEARMSEVVMQRGQLDDLIQSLSRSRDENLVAELDASMRVAQQQAALTGSAEPIVAALKAADERLSHARQPRLDPLRRAIMRDLDRVKLQAVADLPSMIAKLDEAMRLVDEIPLIRDREAANNDRSKSGAARAGVLDAPGAGPAQATEPRTPSWAAEWSAWMHQAWEKFGASIWHEVRSLVRVSRIQNPEAMLITPDQSFFLRENLKLKLLNARLALLSRQTNTAQSDISAALDTVARYFDPASRKGAVVQELLRRVLAQSAQTGVPRPDETTAALAAVSSPR